MALLPLVVMKTAPPIVAGYDTLSAPDLLTHAHRRSHQKVKAVTHPATFAVIRRGCLVTRPCVQCRPLARQHPKRRSVQYANIICVGPLARPAFTSKRSLAEPAPQAAQPSRFWSCCGKSHRFQHAAVRWKTSWGSARVTGSPSTRPRPVQPLSAGAKRFATSGNAFPFPPGSFFGLRNRSRVVLLKRLALISAADETAKC